MMCGSQNPWSLGLSFQVSDAGRVCAKFQAYPRLQGYDGILHGGVVVSLLDAAMTHCLFYRGVQAVTGDMHVRFVQPVQCEALLDVRAWALSETPPLYRVKAELVHEKRVMAWAEATFMERRTQEAEALPPRPKRKAAAPGCT
jgi:uncharacterized protein (TIGR00369 family)